MLADVRARPLTSRFFRGRSFRPPEEEPAKPCTRVRLPAPPPTQARSYIFVGPALVEGTLIEAFRRLADLPPGFGRAASELFLVSEVRPYDDGNRRVARAAMCAELTAAGQTRTVVPIVFRNEYLAALRNLSRERRFDLYVCTLAHVWRWTAGMPWQDRAAVDGYLAATNALTDSTDAERCGVRLELP